MEQYKRRDGVMTADMFGETVMMDIATGKYYNLGEVGGRIWALLEQPMTREALVTALTEEYEVSQEQCDRDIQPFLEKLLEIGLVQLA